MSWYRDNPAFYENELKLVANHPQYNNLHYRKSAGHMILVGNLQFERSLDFNLESTIRDDYNIIIAFPPNYPQKLPEVSEWNTNKIREHKNSHIFRSGSLLLRIFCLGTFAETNFIFSKDPTIINFIDNLLVPFLYYDSYTNKFGKTPYEGRAHGATGLINYYTEYFEISNIKAIIKLLYLVSQKQSRSRQRCPCGSRKNIRSCHRQAIQKLERISHDLILQEIKMIKQFSKNQIL